MSQVPFILIAGHLPRMGFAEELGRNVRQRVQRGLASWRADRWCVSGYHGGWGGRRGEGALNTALLKAYLGSLPHLPPTSLPHLPPPPPSPTSPPTPHENRFHFPHVGVKPYVSVDCFHLIVPYRVKGNQSLERCGSLFCRGFGEASLAALRESPGSCGSARGWLVPLVFPSQAEKSAVRRYDVGPQVVSCYQLFWATKIDYRKKGTLILTSLL